MQRTPQPNNQTQLSSDPADWDRQLIEEQLAHYSRQAASPTRSESWRCSLPAHARRGVSGRSSWSARPASASRP